MSISHQANSPALSGSPSKKKKSLLQALNPLRDTQLFQRDALQFLTDLRAERGDIARFRIFTQPTYLISSPLYIKHILQDNPTNYTKKLLPFSMLRTLMGNSLLTTSDEQIWQQQRQIVQPAFHQQMIAASGKRIADAANEQVKQWEISVIQAVPVDIINETSNLTFQIMSKILFNADISKTSEGFADAFTRALQFLLHQNKFPYLPLFPSSLSHGARQNYQRDLKVIDDCIYSLIEQRREPKPHYTDLASYLLHANLAQKEDDAAAIKAVRDELVSLLTIGQEMTATTLAWAWYLLSQHKTVEQRLHTEVDTVLKKQPPTIADLHKLPYTRMVLEETMRLYPGSWLMLRKAQQADTIAGYTIPRNAYVAWSPYVLHRHPQLWAQPDDFEPAHFSPANMAHIQPYAYLPFSSGPRQCAGNSLATVMMMLILAATVQRYSLITVPGQQIEPEPNFLLRFRHGLSMYIQRRP